MVYFLHYSYEGIQLFPYLLEFIVFESFLLKSFSWYLFGNVRIGNFQWIDELFINFNKQMDNLVIAVTLKCEVMKLDILMPCNWKISGWTKVCQFQIFAIISLRFLRLGLLHTWLKNNKKCCFELKANNFLVVGRYVTKDCFSFSLFGLLLLRKCFLQDGGYSVGFDSRVSGSLS